MLEKLLENPPKWLVAIGSILAGALLLVAAPNVYHYGAPSKNGRLVGGTVGQLSGYALAVVAIGCIVYGLVTLVRCATSSKKARDD